MEKSFRCWGNIVSLICTEWRCDEVDVECDWHTYFLYRGSGSGGSTGKQKVDGDYGENK